MKKIWQTLLIVLVLSTTIQAKATEACVSGLSDNEYKELILGSWIQTEKREANGEIFEARVSYRSDNTFTANTIQISTNKSLYFVFGTWTIQNQMIHHKVTNTNLPFTKAELKKINNIYETIICIGSTDAKFRDNYDGSLDRMIRA